MSQYIALYCANRLHITVWTQISVNTCEYVIWIPDDNQRSSVFNEKKMKAWKLLHCFNVMNLISDTACVIWFLKKWKWSKDSQKTPIMNHTHYIAEVITEMKPLIDFLMVFILIFPLPNILCVSFAYKTNECSRCQEHIQPYTTKYIYSFLICSVIFTFLFTCRNMIVRVSPH